MIGRKIFVLVVTLLIYLSTFGLLNDKIKVEASGGGSGYTSIIDYDNWVYLKTLALSQIVQYYDDYGRDFGEYGEDIAKDYIETWMGSIGLDSVSSDPISGNWNNSDCFPSSDNYCGDLSLKRVPVNSDCWIHVIIKYKNNDTIKYQNNYTLNSDPRKCFPFLKKPDNPGVEGNLSSCNNMTVVNVNKSILEPKSCILVANDEDSPGKWGLLFDYKVQRPQTRAFIVYNSEDSTYFMNPSFSDHKELFGMWPKPGFSINGSEGDIIKYHVDQPALYNVTANMKSHWNYATKQSSNVIGEMHGSSSDKVNIVCAHYDSWWNQGTIDEAAETALVLGIAKYMEDNSIQPKYDTKFIAFAGEEHGYRGSKAYLKEYHDTEEYSWIINPGNFGAKEGSTTLSCASENDIGCRTAENVAEALKYNERTSYNCIGNPDLNRNEGEDGVMFRYNKYYYFNPPDGIMIFSRFPFPGYHCDDGDTHNHGDNISGLDNDSFPVECDIVLLTTLHLIVDMKLQLQDCSITPYDSGNDTRNDSVNVSFAIKCDHNNVPSAGNVTVSIIDKNTNKKMCSNETGFQLINKSETKSGCLNLLLLSEGPGLYDIQVRLINATGDDNDYDDYYNETIYLNLSDNPIADFDYSPLFPTDIENITFTDHSFPSDGPDPKIISRYWDFGDGHNSSLTNPHHKYDDDGYYNVNLTIWDNHNKTNFKIKKIYVRNVPPIPSINVEPIFSTIDSTYWFNSTVYEPDGTIINWTWDFGDGDYSYQQNTTHVYRNSGFYNVKLTVKDDDNATGSANKKISVFDALVNNTWGSDDPEHHKWTMIKKAIDDVGENAMIFVFKGTYNEDVTVEGKSIKIYGEDKEDTIIRGERTVVDIINSTVLIEGFTVNNGLIGIQCTGGSGSEINNCTIQNNQLYGLNFNGSSSNYIHQCNITDGEAGINIVNGSNYSVISECNISSACYGIYIQESSYNYIGSMASVAQSEESNWLPFSDNCKFKNNNYSIYISESDNNIIGSCDINATSPFSTPGHPIKYTTGINLDSSDGNSIVGCKIYGATEYAVYMTGSDDNFMTYCIIGDNNYGVSMSSCSNNLIDYNIIVYNSEMGLSISQTSSQKNLIYLNDFLYNGLGSGTPTHPQARDNGRENLWYKSRNPIFCTAAGEGNYWTDYTGVDGNRDGVGDTPYNITGTAHSRDIYPLMDSLWT